MNQDDYLDQARRLETTARAAVKEGDRRLAKQLYERAGEAKNSALACFMTLPDSEVKNKKWVVSIYVTNIIFLFCKAKAFHKAEQVALIWLRSSLLFPFAVNGIRQMLPGIDRRLDDEL